MIENMGKLGISVWCYNWMAGTGWVRSRTSVTTRGGALTTAFHLEDMEDYPPHRLLERWAVKGSGKRWSGSSTVWCQLQRKLE